MPRHLSRLRIVGASALLATAALAVPAGAGAATKPFSLTISPSSVAAGDTASFSLTFTNRTSQQMLGSANVTVPDGLTLESAGIPAPATAAVSGRTVQLRTLALAPGQSATATVRAAAGCAPGTASWPVIAKQSNDFNGSPGNDLTLEAATSSTTTTVTGGCSLRFATQPQDSRIGEPIRDRDFDPGGSPVQVESLGGSGARLTSSSVSVSVSLTGGSGAASLAGTRSVAAVEGLASFADLSVDTAGFYRLVVASPGAQSATSDAFTVQQLAVQCLEDQDCSAQASTTRSAVTTTAFANTGLDAGFLQLSLNAGYRPDCLGYDEYSADWAMMIGPDRIKQLTFTIAKQVMNASPNNGASFLQMCFAAQYRFAPRPGFALQELDLDGVPGPDTFAALLPDCGVPPCVVSRNKDNAGAGVIQVRAPGGTEDPAYRP